MSHSETVETRGDYRVRIEIENAPDEPYDDGGSPIIRLYRRGYGDYQAEQVGSTSYVLDSVILEAAARWAKEPDVFERYCRIFHGARSFEWRDSGDSRDYIYVTLDPADWREKMGLTDEWLDAHPDVKTTNLTEWNAYCDGDVYGVIVEKRVTWTREHDDEIDGTDGDPSMDDWQEVSAVWGYYGEEYATEVAREQLDAYAPATTTDDTKE